MPDRHDSPAPHASAASSAEASSPEAASPEAASPEAPGPAAPGPEAAVADSVRLALPAEAATVAAVQRRAWATDLDQDLSQWLLTEVDLDAMTTTWHAAITRPPDARCRLLVGVDGASGAVVGFVATSPGDDPDADPARDGLLGEWVVDPQARRRGHGSRLLNAAVDTLRADGFTRAQIWLAATDDVRRQLLHESGWAPDGGHREVGPTAELAQRQVRLHTDITDAGEA